MRPSGVPLYTSSGAVTVVSPGDVVHILVEREYRVLRINLHSSTVVLRRVDATANQRSFMRPSTSICVLPVPTRDASVAVDEPTGNCLCEILPRQDSTKTSQPLFMPSLHHNIKILFPLASYYKYP